MAKIEWIAGQRARDEAIRFERECWLPVLERWLADNTDDDFLRIELGLEIKRLRRCLGIKLD